MNFNEQLQAIQDEYLKKLPVVLDQISLLAQELQLTAPRRDQLVILGQELHKLAGSAGTFGLTRLSSRAAELNKNLDSILSSNSAESDLRNKGLQLKEALDSLSLFAKPGPNPNPSLITPDADVTRTTNNKPLLDQIWLLEAEPQLGATLMAHLESFNFSARLFTNLSELASAFESDQPQILLLDIPLENEGPSTDFHSQCQFFQNTSSRVVFISSKDDFAARLEAASLGAQAYFVKPLDIPNLINRIEQIVANLHSPAEKVLIIDDDEMLAQYYRQVLIGAGMQAEILARPEKVISALESNTPDVILMDLQMPGISGQNLAAVIRQYGRWVGLPIVYLSAEHDPHLQLLALKQGADDFLVKPISNEHLVTVVKSKVARSRQLIDLMTKDSLTSLLKHAAIKDALRRELDLARRKREELCVAMMDIDHFKQINDQFGHAMGDEVIASVATLLRMRLRRTDVLGRYGGEEFVVIMGNCSGDKAFKVLDDFRQRFQELKFSDEEKVFSATISIGIAPIKSSHEIDADMLLVAADKAMYAAKSMGRNKVVLHDAGSAG
ncbi:diguanylate cyclase [Pseudohongiella sp. O18]|uniref:diguanylate cyclase n=1 Tax=Pseudohongiella sp. O18 TaxID=2904248 RepID=UPI001F027281|nr:diguanylate cyclase [Pseudohongiella sp. O18]